MSATSTTPSATDALIQAALALPLGERIKLLEALRDSVEPIDPKVEAAWLAEVHRRLSEYDAGKVEAIPYEEVLKEFESL